MSWADDYGYEPGEERPGPQDDPAVQEIEPLLIQKLDETPDRVFYENQLAVLFEDDFFHWVTARALIDLRESGKIGSELGELSKGVPLRFYFSRRCRYWKRKAVELRDLVRNFSSENFARGLGLQGELLAEAGLPRVGFLPVGHEVRSWNGVDWRETGHDLDRVFERDGLQYGTEIKNRLSYIPQQEFNAKLRMCGELNLIPLFIARMMPRTYIEEVRRAGGFSLIMKYQFYPVTQQELARRVRTELELPVDTPARLRDETLRRFLNWHNGKLERIRANAP